MTAEPATEQHTPRPSGQRTGRLGRLGPQPVPGRPAVELRGAALRFAERILWSGLDLQVEPGEFLAVLGPNGSGKTTLLKVLLGLVPLSAGTAAVAGRPVRRGSRAVGYVPQQRAFDPTAPLRARDLVGLGLDGHRWGFGLPRAARRSRIETLLSEVDALAYADVPVGLLSGGEQQRLRIAQALANDPQVLLCDEPLLSLDLSSQRAMCQLLDQRRHASSSAVVFVTHEINPVLDMVDRILYVIDGSFRLGTPAEVMTTQVLSELYDTHVEVVHSAGRIVVLGAEENLTPSMSRHHDHHQDQQQDHPVPAALTRRGSQQGPAR